MPIKQGSNRQYLVSTLNNGDIIEIGPGSQGGESGTMEIQFNPDANFQGSFQVLGKILGKAGEGAPFMPIPYRRVNLLGAASDLGIVADPVVPAGIIRVPSGGLTVGLLVTCTAGACQLYILDYTGSSAA